MAERAAQVYQYYATINPATCPACLARHGALFTDPAEAPPLHEGCRCACLPIEPQQHRQAQERAQRMQRKAQAELRRRKRFAEALHWLDRDLEQALAALREAVAIDVHVEELEELHRRYRYLFERDLELTRLLRRLFVQAHFDKMDQPKYRWIPPGLYAQLEQQGRERIQALFADPDLERP